MINSVNIKKSKFPSKTALQTPRIFVNISTQSQKTIASRRKLNHLTLANDSTPLNRAFFVRNIRTPQELADFVLFNLKILSMVVRNGQPLAVGCFPMLAVSYPITRYRQP
ncbi:ash family protein [Haemophilus parainfluenzae]|uniref:ash family protein n=1 Tax=Haemophilus parainfluenzae TaxID=729 RepID=UPI0021C7265D|nr:ash family protein [Haemophilus parainfluenzae]